MLSMYLRQQVQCVEINLGLENEKETSKENELRLRDLEIRKD